jgi:capsule polysaccharide export protein KpsE/RkpR
MAMLAAASSSAGSSLGSLAGGLLGLKSSGALFIGILQSRTVQSDIVAKFQLQKVYGDRYEEDARKDLANNSEVFEDRKSGIITIQVTDSDPRRATDIAQEYTVELNRVVNQMSTSSAHREREFLEERLRSVQVDLENAEKEFSQFSSRNATIDIQTQGKAMIEGAATLQGQLIAAQSELQGLKQVYTDDNVRVRSLHAQIGELKSQLNRIDGKDETGVPTTGSESDTPYPSIRKLPLLGVAYADLYRRTKVQEAVFETLTREYELAKVQEVKETPSVKVLDSASIPERKSFPPRPLIILLGTLATFGTGLVWLLFSMLWDETDPEDPRRAFALEVFQGATARLSLRSLNASVLGLAQPRAWSRTNRRHGASREQD